MYLFDSLREVAAQYLPEPHLEALRQAYLVARDAHEGQTRSSGEPYIIHPIAVARILAEMRLDQETLMAALLHDVIEDTEVTKEDLQQRFGDTVADLVDGVSKLDKLKFRDRKEAQAANFRKMIMAMTHDIRVILIKLADRTHNMRTWCPASGQAPSHRPGNPGNFCSPCPPPRYPQHQSGTGRARL